MSIHKLPIRPPLADHTAKKHYRLRAATILTGSAQRIFTTHHPWSFNLLKIVNWLVCVYFIYRAYCLYKETVYNGHCWSLNKDFSIENDSKHLLRYWPIFARSSTLHFAGAVNTRQK